MWERAAVLAVGDEVLTGEVVNSNGAWLAQQLMRYGSRVERQVTVGDDQGAIAAVVRQLLETCDLVVTVGGLGPTPDDRTRQGVSEALSRPLSPDAGLAALVAARHRSSPGRDVAIERQSLRLEGAEILPNPAGTAAGQLVRDGSRAVALLPGPPHECRATAAALWPAVAAATGRRVWRLTWRCYDLTESEMAHYLGDLLTSDRWQAGLYVSPGMVELRFEAPSSDAVTMPAVLAEAAAAARARVPAPLYDESLPTAPEALIDHLRRRGETVALAESLTGGLLGAQLTAVPGASDVVLEGQVVYTDSAKARLGVPEALLRAHGAVSAAVAKELAVLVRARSGAMWGIALTGFAGPSGGTAKDPVGTYYCAVAGPPGVLARRRRSQAARDVVRRAAAETARFLLAGASTGLRELAWESQELQ
jgi:nicotinamide-nucleotide amidase